MQGESDAAVVASVGGGAVHGTHVMQRHLSGPKLHRDQHVLVYPADGLSTRENVVLTESVSVRPDRMVVAAWFHEHTAAFKCRIGQRQPGGETDLGRKAHVSRVLVKAHVGRGIWRLDEEHGAPQEDVGTHQALDRIQDPRVMYDLIETQKLVVGVVAVRGVQALRVTALCLFKAFAQD